MIDILFWWDENYSYSIIYQVSNVIGILIFCVRRLTFQRPLTLFLELLTLCRRLNDDIDFDFCVNMRPLPMLVGTSSRPISIGNEIEIKLVVSDRTWLWAVVGLRTGSLFRFFLVEQFAPTWVIVGLIFSRVNFDVGKVDWFFRCFCWFQSVVGNADRFFRRFCRS